MNLYFRVSVKDEKDIAEVRRYLEIYAPEMITEEPRGNIFRVKAFPITYEHLFQTSVYRTNRGWKQHSEHRIPDSLDDVVEKVEICEDFEQGD